MTPRAIPYAIAIRWTCPLGTAIRLLCPDFPDHATIYPEGD